MPYHPRGHHDTPTTRIVSTYLGDLGGAKRLVQQGVAALGTECDLDSVSQLLYTREHKGTSLRAEAHILGGECADRAHLGERGGVPSNSASDRAHVYGSGGSRNVGRPSASHVSISCVIVYKQSAECGSAAPLVGVAVLAHQATVNPEPAKWRRTVAQRLRRRSCDGTTTKTARNTAQGHGSAVWRVRGLGDVGGIAGVWTA